MTTLPQYVSETIVENPLDLIEELVEGETWAFERSTDDELNISASGSWCDYQITLSWREELESLHMACAFDLKVPENKRSEIYALLGLLNEQQWAGHFDLWSDEGMLLYRYTLLLQGVSSVTPEQCETLLKLSLDTCERFYPAFQFVLWAGKSAQEAVSACMFETEGQA
jgi:hypothetical protein